MSRLLRWAAGLAVFCTLSTASLEAQTTGSVRGTVLAAETGRPLVGAQIRVEGLNAGARTSAEGRFLLDRLPSGRHTLYVELIGRRSAVRTVEVSAGVPVTLRIQLAPRAVGLAGMVVTATREARALAETSATVGVVDADAIERSHASHPSDLLGQVPGVWVNTTGGEGHMTAIRQPLTTNPVYLYLEDGVPTRSTGFFNHNAMYEINVPQADRIEVLKGPSSALYGSDAIGGVINVRTQPAVQDPGLEASLEGGRFGWGRLLASGAFVVSRSGLRLDLNLTRTDGWRDGTAYDRQSATMRWDQRLDDASSLKTVLAFSRVDQNTAGSSRLSPEDYRERPTLNYTPISYRDVRAVRLSVEYQRTTPDWHFTLTPFVRSNRMDMLPNWSLTYDPAIEETSNRSLGVLAQARRTFAPMDARVLVGLDVDWSPGERFERAIEPVRNGATFVGYSLGPALYDYDVTFLGVSPYARLEASPTDALHLRAGLRIDRVGYDYGNRLGAVQTGEHRRPASTTTEYTHLSPKLGATLELGAGASIFAAYGHGFRVPSEGQLFRQGRAENTVALEPVEAKNLEAGVRAVLGDRLGIQLSAYRMVKTNDILDFQHPDDTRETQNAGETLHRGLELGLDFRLTEALRAGAALSYARHSYEHWRPAPGVDYGGQEMEDAPQTIGNASLAWEPGWLPGAIVTLDWSHVGEYWLNPENTERYGGHDLFSATADVPLTAGFTAFARVSNLTDVRYAETAGFSAFRGREFAPGMPRRFTVGFEYDGGGSP